ncbi:hypothetical protein ES708_22560 [subsurface metagenome]
MERARFFATLHWGRALKRGGYNKVERISRLFCFRFGFENGYMKGREDEERT